MFPSVCSYFIKLIHPFHLITDHQSAILAGAKKRAGRHELLWLSVKACGISEGFALVGSGSYQLASGRNTRHLDSHSPFVEPSLSGY